MIYLTAPYRVSFYIDYCILKFDFFIGSCGHNYVVIYILIWSKFMAHVYPIGLLQYTVIVHKHKIHFHTGMYLSVSLCC